MWQGQMDKHSFAQQQRLKYIDFRLMFVGHFTRAEVVENFKLGLSSATRDINIYKDLAGQNLTYDNAEKRYFITETFKPLFEHNKDVSCREFATQILSGSNSDSPISLSFEKQSQLVTPNILIVATITQAMINIKAITIEYLSPQSGLSQRVVIPHSIVDNGLRWHIRAFDEKSNQFRDFVITRIVSAKLIDKQILERAKILSDQQWMRIVHLELVPHPKNVKYPQAVECDYGMDQRILKLEVRSALTGYILRRWNVDCSENATQRSPEHQLWLHNRATLYGVDNLHLASGYTERESKLSSRALKANTND
jgi:hypothetical protein